MSAGQAVKPKTGRGTKSREPRKHHYVPVFYQKNFTNDSELLWVYDRGLRALRMLTLNLSFSRTDSTIIREGITGDGKALTRGTQTACDFSFSTDYVADTVKDAY